MLNNHTKQLKEYILEKIAYPKNISYSQKGLEEIALWGLHYFLMLLQTKSIFSDNVSYSMEEIQKKLRLLPSYYVQLNELLLALARQKLIFSSSQHDYKSPHERIDLDQLLREKKLLLNNYPQLEWNINFLHHLLEDYLAILSGEMNFLSVLFPCGSFNVIERLYKENPELNYYNTAIAKIICYLIEYLLIPHSKNFINVLEIGAGVGSTSAVLLPLLNKLEVEKNYQYTDISNAFLEFGRHQFKQSYKFLDFSRYNINLLPATQELRENYYDVILATNVMHNAINIKQTLLYVNSLLSSGGILVLNEGIASNDYSTLIYGLSSGWWAFKDPEWRIPGTPLICLSVWKKLLVATGFCFYLSLNEILNGADIMSHDVIIGIKV